VQCKNPLAERESYQVQALGVNFQRGIDAVDAARALDDELLMQTDRGFQRGWREFQTQPPWW
jgi:hypothetical protein